ncbi:MAG: hypothetical protein L0Y72_05555 [Gemmataceae bacterium]|nr:hypothetical protein [Gemmataceae bacterium]MCI0738490.1 hypothetical protein [Gemmataceae bacterium]
MKSLPVVVLALLAWCAQAPAQEKQIKDPKVKFADDNAAIVSHYKNLGVAFEARTPENLQPRSDFRHGNVLLLTFSDEGKSQTRAGTLVRVDHDADTVWLRTQPGQPPVAIPRKSISKVEVGMKAGSGIRLAGGAAEAKQEFHNQPEIRQVVIYNGAYKTTKYFSDTLSPGEQARLAELEAAEEEAVRLQQQLDSQSDLARSVLISELAARSGIQESQRIFNDLMRQQMGYVRGNSPTHLLALLQAGQRADPPGLLTVDVAPSQAALQKARDQLRSAQSRAVYEDGRIVAVVLDDSKEVRR